MEGIRSNVAMGVQPQKKSNKVLKHALNAGVVAGGSYAIGKGASELWGNHRLYSPQIIKPEYMRPVQKLFEKIGEKIFSPKTILGQVFECEFGEPAKAYADLKAALGESAKYCKNYKAALKEYKARGAVFALGAVAILSLITSGIYKAGKINGEN